MPKIERCTSFSHPVLHKRLDELTRRGFIEASTAALLASVLGCEDRPDDPTPPGGPDLGPGEDAGTEDAGTEDLGPSDLGTPDAVTVFDVYRELRDALRESPDHRTERARRLVEAGDPQALFGFVRDEILLIPDDRNRFVDGGVLIRWGTRATLRGGAGTAREKSELLAELLREAGFEARVLRGPWERPADTRAMFLRARNLPAFEPALDSERVAELRGLFGLGAPDPETQVIDPNGDESAALAEGLVNLLEAQNPDFLFRFFPNFDFRVPSFMSEVSIQTPEGEVFVNPNIPDADYGRSYLFEQGVEAPPTFGERTLTVRLRAASTTAPESSFTLLERTYLASEVVGRQLMLGTPPGMPLQALASTSFEGVRTFAPVLGVQAPDLPPEDAAALSVIGQAVTVQGTPIELGDDGTVRVGDTILASPEREVPSLSRVASVQIEDVRAGQFPDVVLRASVLDADDQPLPNLPVEAFRLEEDGQPVPILMRRNDSAPQLVVLSDASLSMPAAFRGPAGAAFAEGLADDLREVEPNVQVRFETSDSRLWTALSTESQKKPTAVVFITDGDLLDQKTPEIEAILSSGPPCILLQVTSNVQPALEEMATLTGGTVVRVTSEDTAEAVDAVATFLRALEVPPYEFIFSAPLDGPSLRTVILQLPLGSAPASDPATYEVPAQPAPPTRLCGLYLDIETGGQTIQRVLAGRSPWSGLAPSEQDVRDVTDALFGQSTIFVEAGMPSNSMWLDDVLTAKLDMEAFYAAASRGSAEEALAAYEAGLRHLPAEPFAVQPSLRAAASPEVLAYETELRVAIFTERVRLGTDRVLSKVDILPTSRIATCVDSLVPFDRVVATIRATTPMAIAEGSLFDVSTQDLLSMDPAEFFGSFDARPYRQVDGVSAELEANWHGFLAQSGAAVRLLPLSGAPFAYWSFDISTGAVLGILPDGSGGGSSEVQMRESLQRIDRAIAALNLLTSAASSAGAVGAVGAFSLGLVAAYGQFLARLYAAVSVTISLLDASQLDRDVRVAILGLACNVLKNITTGLTKDVGAAVGNIENVMSLLTINNPAGCP